MTASEKRRLWRCGSIWAIPVRSCTKQFFYGKNGTCCREDLDGGAYIDKDGVFHESVDNCPSVGELEARGKRPYRYYCEHCYWLYHKSLEEHGFSYDADYELQPKDCAYSKTCSFLAKARG